MIYVIKIDVTVYAIGSNIWTCLCCLISNAKEKIMYACMYGCMFLFVIENKKPTLCSVFTKHKNLHLLYCLFPDLYACLHVCLHLNYMWGKMSKRNKNWTIRKMLRNGRMSEKDNKSIKWFLKRNDSTKFK